MRWNLFKCAKWKRIIQISACGMTQYLKSIPMVLKVWEKQHFYVLSEGIPVSVAFWVKQFAI